MTTKQILHAENPDQPLRWGVIFGFALMSAICIPYVYYAFLLHSFVAEHAPAGYR